MKTIWKEDRTGRNVMIDMGRNDECACGSKMKFKHCCMDSVMMAQLMPIRKSFMGRLKADYRKAKAKRHARIKRIAIATKRYNAKMKRRNRVEVKVN